MCIYNNAGFALTGGSRMWCIVRIIKIDYVNKMFFLIIVRVICTMDSRWATTWQNSCIGNTTILLIFFTCLGCQINGNVWIQNIVYKLISPMSQPDSDITENNLIFRLNYAAYSINTCKKFLSGYCSCTRNNDIVRCFVCWWNKIIKHLHILFKTKLADHMIQGIGLIYKVKNRLRCIINLCFGCF